MSAEESTRATRLDEIALLEAMLAIELPKTYRRFLEEKGSGSARGLPILGLPLAADQTSVWGATTYLHTRRPDLGSGLVVIRILDDRALCLDLRHGTDDDAAMVKVSFLDRTLPISVDSSFPDYLDSADEQNRQVQVWLDRINEHLLLQEKAKKPYDHSQTSGRPPFKGHDWRVVRSCIHDHVVGLAAFRHSRRHSELEVDLFACTDHPSYEPGYGSRGLLLLLLSDAHRNGARMSMSFTSGPLQGGDRHLVEVPSEIVRTAYSVDLILPRPKLGRIHEADAIELYARLVGVDQMLRDRINQLPDHESLTLMALSYVIGSRVWTSAQTLWLLQNAARPERVLFGLDTPEQRPAYEEARSLVRSVVAIERLARCVADVSTVEEGPPDGVDIQPAGPAWRLTSDRPTRLGWMVSGEAFDVAAGTSIYVLSAPRQLVPWEARRVHDDARVLADLMDKSSCFLLYSSDIRGLPDLEKLVGEVREAYGVQMLVMPSSARGLDSDVEKRRARARKCRR